MSASRLIAEVEACVDLGPVQRRAGFEGAVHLGDASARATRNRRRCSALGGDARGNDLEAFEQREHLDDRGARDGRDGGADVRNAQHQPLGLEQAERFAHGNDADFELTRQIVDDETSARCELAADDRFAQRRVDELLLRQVPGLRRRRDSLIALGVI